MNIRIAQRGKQGFSLVELLLTLVLILCLAAASVFTFTAIYKTANLDEGSDRFQSLIRFAQAEAATTGRKVRLQFVPAQSAEEAGEELREIKVTWEADLLNAPGVFEEYTNKAWSEEIVNELVGVTKVAAMSESGEPMPAQGEVTQAGVGEGSDIGTTGVNPMSEALESSDFPSITFYPDGSCDSAEVVLASRNGEDERRLAVRLGGLLGTVSTRTVSSSQEGEAVDAEAEAFEEFNEEFERSAPVSESSRDFSASAVSSDFAE